MQLKQKNDSRKQILLILVAMIGFALFVSTKNILIPAFKQSFAIGNTLMGGLVFAFSLSFTIMTYFSERIYGKFGHQKTIVSSLMGMSLTALGLWRVGNTVIFSILFVGQSGFIAVLLFGLNTMVPLISVGNQALLMNILHFCYSLGAMTMSRSIGIAMGSGVSWPQIYLVISVILLLIAGVNLFGKYPAESTQVKSHGLVDTSLTMKNPLLLGVIGTFAASLVAETVMGQWFSNYMVESFSFEINQAANLMFLYLAAHALGRLIGGFVAGRFGIQKTLVVFSIISCLITGAGIAMGVNGLYLIAASGFFMSIIYPTNLLFAQSLFPNHSVRATSLVLTSVSFVNIFTGMVIGILNDQITAYYTFYLVPLMLVVSLFFQGLVWTQNRKLKGKKIEE